VKVIAETTMTPRGKMKALVQEGFGSADVLHLREIERPTIEETQVLVRVRAASVNALDWHSVRGGTVMRMASTVMGRKQKEIRSAASISPE
jgi:NADPH:quinone reductase-like Zn-dependent oxidoreductase